MGRTSDARQRLIEAACRLFQARGYGAVGVKDICAQAGVNKGSFYHFFPSKQELAIAAIEHYWDDSERQMSVALEADAPPLKRIERFLDWHYNDQRCARLPESGCLEGCTLGNLALELSAREEPIRQALDSAFQKWVGRLKPVLADAMEAGDIERRDPAALAREMIAYLEGATLLAKTHNDIRMLKALRSGVARLLGVRADDEGPAGASASRLRGRKKAAGLKVSAGR